MKSEPPTFHEIQDAVQKASECFKLLVADLDVSGLEPDPDSWQWDSIRRKLRNAMAETWEPRIYHFDPEPPEIVMEALNMYDRGRDMESRLGFLEAAAVNLPRFPSRRLSATETATQARESRVSLKALLDRATVRSDDFDWLE